MCYGEGLSNVHERNYPTHDLGLAAIVLRSSLGGKFEFLTDHKPLKYFFLSERPKLEAAKVDGVPGVLRFRDSKYPWQRVTWWWMP